MKRVPDVEQLPHLGDEVGCVGDEVKVLGVGDAVDGLPGEVVEEVLVGAEGEQDAGGLHAEVGGRDVQRGAVLVLAADGVDVDSLLVLMKDVRNFHK